jgi:hypothetical protein
MRQRKFTLEGGVLSMSIVELLKLRAVLPIFVLFCLFAQSGAAFAEEYVEGEAMVLLKYDEIPSPSDDASSYDAMRRYVRSVAARSHATVVKIYDALSSATGEIFAHFRSESESETTEQLIARLKRDPNVISASPNHISRISIMQGGPQ